MHEVMEKVKRICELKESLVSQVTPHIHDGVFSECVDGCAVGQVVDMIKDLCDAEKNLYKACYYKTVIEAMKEAEEGQEDWIKAIGAAAIMNLSQDDNNRMGYDNWRYSSGRFAPKGSGHYAGYTAPMPHTGHPDMNNRMMQDDTRMNNMMGNAGYPHHMSGSYRSTGRYGYPMDETHSKSYNDYEDAKKYYTESKDPEAKKEMAEHAKKHLMEVLDTTEDIWDDAKPEAKKEFKEQMMKLLKDMPMN